MVLRLSHISMVCYRLRLLPEFAFALNLEGVLT